MPIIIDAWNLIRNRKSDIPDDEGDGLEAARQLISYLTRFQQSHSDPITLVFDSRSEYLGVEYKNSRKLSIVATRNADEYIKKRIDMVPERQRRNVRVVSSDNSVYYYAKSSYSTPVTCEDFWNTLNKKRDFLKRKTL